MDAPALVFVAGIGGSGPDHWQSRWHARSGASTWVQHRSWDHPVRDEWVDDLDEHLRAIDGPKVLVAHSLGSLLVTEWAAGHVDAEVLGALLVAVPDVRSARFPTDASGFGTPAGVLPFDSVVVASEDDPYATLGHAASVADAVGAELVNVGRRGHINAASGLGEWAEGRTELDKLLRSVRAAT